jgi:hypothetical protein
VIHIYGLVYTERIIFKPMLEKQRATMWTGFTCLRKKPVACSCEFGNEFLDYKNYGECLDLKSAC